jgi:type IV secretory pathway TraG/TraD family ATPase VirD4
VWQDLNQAREVFGVNNAKTLLANSGCLFAFNPGNDSDTAEFLSRLSGDHLVPGLSVSDDAKQLGDRGTIAPQRERLWSPERIRNLPERHALLFRAGEAEPVSLYCPPYWDIEACRRVARPDPYHGHMPARQTGRRWRGLVVACAGAALLAGMLMLLSN